MTGGGRAVTVERDLAYATVDGTEPGTPVVMYVHGGGWTRGDKGR